MLLRFFDQLSHLNRVAFFARKPFAKSISKFIFYTTYYDSFTWLDV